MVSRLATPVISAGKSYPIGLFEKNLEVDVSLLIGWDGWDTVSAIDQYATKYAPRLNCKANGGRTDGFVVLKSRMPARS
jgi:hypothetical protein